MVVFQPSGRRGQVEDGTSVLEASRELGVGIEAICGEKRTCGKCKVRIEDGFFEALGITSSPAHVSPRMPIEDKFFTAGATGLEGYRLACMADDPRRPRRLRPGGGARRTARSCARPSTDRKINVNPSVRTYYVEMEPPTLHDPLGDYERLCDALKAQHGLERPLIDYRVLLGLRRDAARGRLEGLGVDLDRRAGARDRAGRARAGSQRSIGLAVDVGTTSVAAYLCDLETGEVIGYDAMMNPQVPYGEDVMSRITYAMSHDDGIEKLQAAIVEGVNTLAARVTEAAGFTSEDILEMAVVFNTAMHHCFLGIDPEYLGVAPYAPALQHSINIKARDLGLDLCPGANVFVLPNEAGFVGADNVGRAHRRRAVEAGRAPADHRHRHQRRAHHGQQGAADLVVVRHRARPSRARRSTSGCARLPGAIEKIYINPETKEPRYRVIGKDAWSDEMPPEDDRQQGHLRVGDHRRRGRAVQGRHHRQVRAGS